MAEQFYTLVTNIGKAKIANSVVLGTKINLTTTKIGDGNGAYYNPTEDQEDLVNVKWSGAAGSVSIDEKNPNWIVVETILPGAVGGFTIREVGIFDNEGDLIAITKCPESYKPVIDEGTTKEWLIRTIFEVSNASSITLKIDPTVILATKSDIKILEAEIQEIRNEISNDNEFTQSVAFGMNSVIRNNSKNAVSPKFTIKGKTLINLLGKDGNCEDVSKWYIYQSTSALDSNNKVFGNNGIKVTLTSTSGNITNPISKYNLDISKYYLISAYLKNGNSNGGVQIMKDSNGGPSGSGKSSIFVTDTSKFTRVGVIVKPSDITSGNNITINAIGSSGQYFYVDGIMINEITADEYDLGADALLEKYPYVDSYSCLQNPYIEVRHDNLVRNGNGEEGVAWWKPTLSSAVTLNVVNSKLQLNVINSGHGFYQTVPVKKNTNYYIVGNADNNGQIQVNNVTNSTPIRLGSGVFNSGDSNQVNIVINKNSSIATGISNFDSIILIEGTTAPTKYMPCRVERVVIEGKFTNDDSIVFENGEVTGLLDWKHKTLYGKDYDWQFDLDCTGSKRIKCTPFINNVFNKTIDIMTKYDGSILSNVVACTLSNQFANNSMGTYANIADTETGWTENINPNNDEVKAFMNGWRVIGGTWEYNNNRYVSWTSVVDGSYPSVVPQTTVSSAYAASSTTLVVADGAKFIVGEHIYLVGYGFAIIGSISGNILTLSNTCGVAVPVGTIVIRCDNGSTDSRILNYCKNNIAPGYEGYQLHYKLANPELINDDNVYIHGDIPKFDVGDNYLYLDSGMVLGETANPKSDGTNTDINDPTSAFNDDLLKYYASNIFAVYRNGAHDSKWTIDMSTFKTTRAWMPNASYDSNSTYTVDYKILATIAPQIGSVDCSYIEDIADTLNKLQEEVNNRQAHDSILDTIIDLSIYEKISSCISSQWFIWGNTAFVQFLIPIAPKKVQPVLTIDNIFIGINGIGNKTFKLDTIKVLANNTIVSRFISTDIPTINNIKTYGIDGQISITLDCRGRI